MAGPGLPQTFPLLGREAECAAIDALLAEARAGRGGALVVRGEAGVGKLALLDYARERVAQTLGLAPSARADRLLISAAVLGLLAAAAEDRPAMAGRPSADALVFTARQLRAERLAILFPARDGEVTMFEAPVFRS